MNAPYRTPAAPHEPAEPSALSVTRIRHMKSGSTVLHHWVELTVSDGRVFGTDGGGVFRSCRDGQPVKRGGPLAKMLEAAHWLFEHCLWKGET